MSEEVRVRFAPSPTGFLHIGGVRTALYCWLWAQKTGGKFVLRIEDTDQARNTDESVDLVFESMKWVGLNWDEGPDVGGPDGPYFQAQRREIYTGFANKLIESGKAYRCFATKEETQKQREAYEAEHGKKGFRFQSPWRDKTGGDPTQPHSVRFKSPKEGSTSWDDLLRDNIEVPNTQQQDFVILRPNGLPLYNFACVVDDVSMRINLVVRGDDHIINTPPQILLYEALGAKVPQFAHLPMVLGPDKKKLSKRHAAVSVLEYRDMGYLPDAVINYLARLGWSHGDEEIFTRKDLIEKFDWKNVGVTSGQYDKKKFEFVQAQHLRMLENNVLGKWVGPWLAKRGLPVAPDDPTLIAAIAQVKLRATTLEELAEGLDYFFREALVFDEKAKKKFLKPEFAPHLLKLHELVSAADFKEEPLEAAVVAWMETQPDLKMKHVAQPARVALTGRTKSPGLYETMVLLGRDRTLKRLEAGAKLAEAATA